jgi:hypothetical protein
MTLLARDNMVKASRMFHKRREALVEFDSYLKNNWCNIKLLTLIANLTYYCTFINNFFIAFSLKNMKNCLKGR